jgi:HEAT repeat protein
LAASEPLAETIEELRSTSAWDSRMGVASQAVSDTDLMHLKEVVSSLLDSGDPLSRRAGGDLLVAMAGAKADRRAWARRVLDERLGTETDPVLLERLLEAGSAFRDGRFLPDIVRAATHDHPIVRRRAAAAFGRQADENLGPDADAALIGLSTDEDEEVRNWALFSLGHQRDGRPLETPEAMAAYAAALRDDNDEIRCGALEALGRLGDINALSDALWECDVDDKLLGAAREVADSRLIEPLLALREDAGVDQSLVSAALEACKHGAD